MPTGPSLAVVKGLFARSQNRCAFVGCSVPLVEENDTVTGEICHIKAAKGGPRYDSKQSPAQRHAAANLILMCSRHHKIIDSEPRNYPAPMLIQWKLNHELAGFAEISPRIASVAETLLRNYCSVAIHSNTGQIAIQSPGAVQASTINLNTIKTKLSVNAPAGSIGADRKMVSYCTYLIGKYQECQKRDFTGKGEYKYMAIHLALKRKFKSHWQLLGEGAFQDVVAFLQDRINKTIAGKNNTAKGHRNYHEFNAHP